MSTLTNVYVKDWIEIAANLVTILGLVLLIGSFIVRIYQSFHPLKNVKFLVNGLDTKELKKTKNYLYFGENIFFSCIFNVNNPSQTVIDEITLCVEHGLSSFDYLYHVIPNERVHFSVSNQASKAFVYDSKDKVDDHIKVFDFNQFKGKSYIRKLTMFRTLSDVYEEREELLDKIKRGVQGYECIDQIPVFSPMLYVRITSNNVTSIYAIFAFLTEGFIN